MTNDILLSYDSIFSNEKKLLLIKTLTLNFLMIPWPIIQHLKCAVGQEETTTQEVFTIYKTAQVAGVLPPVSLSTDILYLYMPPHFYDHNAHVLWSLFGMTPKSHASVLALLGDSGLGGRVTLMLHRRIGVAGGCWFSSTSMSVIISSSVESTSIISGRSLGNSLPMGHGICGGGCRFNCSGA